MYIKIMHQVSWEKSASQTCKLWRKLKIPYTVRYVCGSKDDAQGKSISVRYFMDSMTWLKASEFE